jgi:membrane associated rhomboid family serine protease
MNLHDAGQALGRHLVVRHGYTPLGRLLGPSAGLDGLFDAVLARFQGQDLWVQALLTDAGGDAAWAAHRAEALRSALGRAHSAVRGRVHAAVWMLCEGGPRAQALQAQLLDFEDGHFLSPVLVGRGVLGLDGFCAYAGRAQPQPGAAELAGALAGPGLDPGEGAQALTLEARELDERGARRLLRPAPSPVTWLLIAVNAGAFLVQLLLYQALQKQGLDGPGAQLGFNELLFLPGRAGMQDLLTLGANLAPLTVGEGQWWRLLASAFLHGGLLHIGVNMLALFRVGPLAERLMGPWRFLALYLASALAASALSAAMHPAGPASVGASGAIFGVVGVLMAPRWRRAPGFPQGLALRLHQWLFSAVILTFGLGLALGATDGPFIIDNAAHTGGLLCGFAIGYLWPSFLARSGPWKA